LAQTNTSRVIGSALLLFCVALALTAYTARRPALARAGSAVFSETLAPLQALYSTMHAALEGVWDRYLNLVRTKEDNSSLRRRLAVLEAENSRLRELQSENKRLRSLLALAEQTSLSGVVARVVAYDPSNWSRKITINRGSASGVGPGMAVLEGNGVVGQVVAAGPGSAQVLLLNDPNSGVDAMIQNSRARGMVEGTGGKRCRMSYVQADEHVQVGDRVITSGLDGVFPKGLLIGVISSVGEREKGMLFQSLEVKAAVDFGKLEDLLVVREER